MSFTFLGCLISNNSLNCRNYINEFNTSNWSLTNNDSILVDTKKLFQTAKSTDTRLLCIDYLNTKKVQRFFGKPHHIEKKVSSFSKEGNLRYCYYLNLGCYNPEIKNTFCEYYFFEFNNKNQCVNFGHDGIFLQKK